MLIPLVRDLMWMELVDGWGSIVHNARHDVDSVW